ncbi:MAG: AmmeMemoRadiSam system protein B [Deltaproteobacteria bacterium]
MESLTLLQTRRVRPAAVASQFYPGDAAALARTIDDLLARAPAASEKRQPKALMVPHAGYVYSGAIAASAYVTLRPFARVIRRVVLLGPAHRVRVRGCALPEVDAFETPLGLVPVDQDAACAIEGLPGVTRSARAHAPEHSLEVQLPFLQRVLEKFSLVPLVVGDANPREIVAMLGALWGGDETLFVISSDLSHYLPYSDAMRLDGETMGRIARLDERPLDHDMACGATPVNGMVLAARAHGLVPTVLDVRNSGDTAGSRDQVVGYAAVAFHERP